MKGGVIYISSIRIPKITNYIFSGNKTTITGFGKDIVYNYTFSSSYSTTNILSTCSSSLYPQISGSSFFYVFFSLTTCGTMNNYKIYKTCTDYTSNSEYRSGSEKNTKDSPYIWKLNKDGSNGNCVFNSNINCNEFLNEDQCIHINNEYDNKYSRF
jgi:hypothetical protein